MSMAQPNNDITKDSKLNTVIGIPAFPNDLPTIEELREYVPHLLARIDAMGLSAYMRGAEPPYVLQYKERDLSLLPELPATCGETAKEARIALRATMTHENDIKADMKREWGRDQQQKVATLVLVESEYILKYERLLK